MKRSDISASLIMQIYSLCCSVIKPRTGPASSCAPTSTNDFMSSSLTNPRGPSSAGKPDLANNRPGRSSGCYPAAISR